MRPEAEAGEKVGCTKEQATEISQDQAAGRTWDGSATPAVQWGSVPRRLIFTALQ